MSCTACRYRCDVDRRFKSSKAKIAFFKRSNVKILRPTRCSFRVNDSREVGIDIEHVDLKGTKVAFKGRAGEGVEGETTQQNQSVDYPQVSQSDPDILPHWQTPAQDTSPSRPPCTAPNLQTIA